MRIANRIVYVSDDVRHRLKMESSRSKMTIGQLIDDMLNKRMEIK